MAIGPCVQPPPAYQVRPSWAVGSLSAIFLVQPSNLPTSEPARGAMDAAQGRKYKSRKQRPCDACRRRKICCVREPNDPACSLCRMQKTDCQYQSKPNPRRRREKATSPTDVTQDKDPLISSTKGADPVKAPEWIYQFVGLSGDQDPFVLRHCLFDGSNHYRRPDWACYRVKNDLSNEIPLHFSAVPEAHLDARPAYYPASTCLDKALPYQDDLFRTFFEVVHTSYPLLDASRLELAPSWGTLHAVMYGLALPFSRVSASAKLDVVELYHFIFQALPIDARSPRFEIIEAALLFLQRHTQVHRVPTTPGIWSEIGSIVGMAQEAGLNVDPTRWDISQSDKNRRIRMWWALYIHDKWTALGLGRPSYIHDEDCNVPLPSLENIPTQSWNGLKLPRRSAMQFVAMAALTTILSDILKTFYTMKALDRLRGLSPEAMYELMQHFQGRLNVFYDDYLLPLNDFEDETFLDPTGTSFLAFYTVEVVLIRAILRCLSPSDPQYPTMRLYAKEVVTCVTALLEKLQVGRLRAFWWSPVSRINFATAGGFMFSLLLTSTDDDEIEYWTSQIARYRRLLELQSLSFDTTKLAAVRMGLLASMSGTEDGRTARVEAMEKLKPEEAFCRDFGVDTVCVM